MKSKRLVYVLIACLCLMLCGCEKNLDNTQQSKNTAVSSAQEAAANGFEYEVCDAYVKITGYSKSEPAVSVPETINGKPVKVIGEEAFYGQTDMSEIHLPFGLEVIENGAFYRCSALKSVNIPKSVTQIGNDVFFRCSALQSITVDDENGKYCDVDGVLFNKDKSEIIAYPEGKTETKYTIPDSVTKISGNVFGYQSALKEIVVPASVTELPNHNIFVYPDEITLAVMPGSAAEAYAKEQNIKYSIRNT